MKRTQKVEMMGTVSEAKEKVLCEVKKWAFCIKFKINEFVI